ncbi:MAG: hypothetical protein JRI76_06920 [Deltaproteobacteria bacterium]|nr:hypothetical protein [Deltaproteobacteria bacterium]MBW1955982.1 hypothetical protein [Deltaproteobacteria bacterium]MBW2041752.1 hypothetical protein [Deltaproteobacteria bacterium]MBW2132138.1 hypothetical protein [Deltaproteobacteria bacterium]
MASARHNRRLRSADFFVLFCFLTVGYVDAFAARLMPGHFAYQGALGQRDPWSVAPCAVCIPQDFMLNASDGISCGHTGALAVDAAGNGSLSSKRDSEVI